MKSEYDIELNAWLITIKIPSIHSETISIYIRALKNLLFALSGQGIEFVTTEEAFNENRT